MNPTLLQKLDVLEGELSDIKGQMNYIVELYSSVINRIDDGEQQENIESLLSDIKENNTQIRIKLEEICDNMPKVRH